MSAKKGLGRSFESLIPDDLLDESFDPTAADDGRVSDLRTIKLSEIVTDPNQPRRSIDEKSLKELTASIHEHGVLQPIVVAPHGDGTYIIVAGERRFRASMAAGKDTIPALVRTLSAQHKLELSLIENIQRRDLNPLETATAYAKLRDQFNLTLEEIGQRVGGKSVSAVSNTLRLLRLPESAKKALYSGDITEGQARPFVGCDEKIVARILPKIISESWSARAIEAYFAQQKTIAVEKEPRTPSVLSPHYVETQKRLMTRLDTAVTVKAKPNGKGVISIAFKDSDDFERIKKLLS